jgi:hypothetical protein
MRSKTQRGQRSLGLFAESPARLTPEELKDLTRALAELLLAVAKSEIPRIETKPFNDGGDNEHEDHR